VRLYLDLCCLNRPFDEQSQPRIQIETHSVMHILGACRAGRHQLVASTALNVENSQTPNPERCSNVAVLIGQADSFVDHSTEIDRRASQLVALGFGNMDAYHTASAESGRCDRLVTTDDRFLKHAVRHSALLTVFVTNPVQLVAEGGFG
jgi:hypothetical protein